MINLLKDISLSAVCYALYVVPPHSNSLHCSMVSCALTHPLTHNVHVRMRSK